MMKAFRNLVAGLAIASGIIAFSHAAPLSPPAVNGPWLGDQVNNLATLINAHILGSGYGIGAPLSVSQTSGQANCTPTGNANMLHNIATSAATGYICLPKAVSGRFVMYFNATGQTIDVYGSASSFVPGTQDTINTVAGDTAYTGLTTHKALVCFASKDGAWACGAIS